MTPFATIATTIFSSATIVLDVIVLILAILFIGFIFSPKDDTSTSGIFFIKFSAVCARYVVWVAWVISIGAVFGSLFYSWIIGFEPCTLCWWQRIFLFPQAVLFTVLLIHSRTSRSLSKEDQQGSIRTFFYYSGVMSVIGFCIAIYHYYGQSFNNSVLSCSTSAVSCAKLYFTSFGFITIPFMSMTMFAALIVIVLFGLFGTKKDVQTSSSVK